MLSIDPLTISSLIILAAGSGAPRCALPEPTEINVIPKTSRVEREYSMNLAQLQGVETDTLDPYSFHGTSITNGYATSPVTIVPKVTMKSQYFPQWNAVCLWYDTIDINIDIAPKITIAKEITEDKCKHKAVFAHEMKHVRVTREVINKYARSMGTKVHKALQERGFIAGPIPAANAQEIQKRMSDTVQQIIEFEFKKFELEHQERQQAVDSLAEYERVNAQCPHFDYTGALKSPAD